MQDKPVLPDLPLAKRISQHSLPFEARNQAGCEVTKSYKRAPDPKACYITFSSDQLGVP